MLKLCCLYIMGIVFAKSACTETHKQAAMATEVELKIYHYKVPCMGEAAQLCFKIERPGGGPEAFYDAIAGFEYEWGYNYTLLLTKTEIKNPAADASSFQYKLKKILKKEPAQGAETFELPLLIDDQRFIVFKRGKCCFFDTVEIETGRYSCAQMLAAQSAVFRHNKAKKGLIVVQLK